jgi:NAD(P)-dependent dehydrogenase (short-subunit alcohol dehydrogenase family)
MSTSLSGKVALVTGAGRDVGRAIALTLAAEGAAVAVNYSKSAEAAEKVVAEIVAAGGKGQAWGADIGDFDSTKAMVDDIVAVFGSIDIVVNNAGVAQRARFLETTTEQWQNHIDVGLMGTVNTSRAALPQIAEIGRSIAAPNMVRIMGRINSSKDMYAATGSPGKVTTGVLSGPMRP